MQLKQWLLQSTSKLTESAILSAKLDALILLEDELHKDRSWILAHDDYYLSSSQIKKLNNKIAQRIQRIPLAYIRKFVEFYSRQFTVTPHVLIPRPETEELIDITLGISLPRKARVIDVGTGSGCIAVTLKAVRPSWYVVATDISRAAIKVAKKNADTYKADITFLISDLLLIFQSDLSIRYHLIIANLPYVAHDYGISPDVKAEPAIAVYANDQGYDLIEKLLPQAAITLHSGGYLVLESDPWQQKRIMKAALNIGFVVAEQRRFHLVFCKVQSDVEQL